MTETPGQRAGAYALTVLASPLNAAVLTELAGGPKPLAHLRQAAGTPSQTTMRTHLRALERAGILRHHRQETFPGSLDYELASPGEQLVTVADMLDRWLAECPQGSIEFGGVGSKGEVKALAEGWETGIVHALAVRPFTLTELVGALGGLNYPSVERRLTAMRQGGQLEPLRTGRGTPYAINNWLRKSVAVITAAVRWELRHAGGSASPLSPADFEATCLLAMPLVSLPAGLVGSCRLLAEAGEEMEGNRAGVVVGVEAGLVTDCSVSLDEPADSHAAGSAGAWLAAVMDRDPGTLEISGEPMIATQVVHGLHAALFGDIRG